MKKIHNQRMTFVLLLVLTLVAAGVGAERRQENSKETTSSPNVDKGNEGLGIGIMGMVGGVVTTVATKASVPLVMSKFATIVPGVGSIQPIFLPAIQAVAGASALPAVAVGTLVVGGAYVVCQYSNSDYAENCKNGAKFVGETAVDGFQSSVWVAGSAWNWMSEQVAMAVSK
jgi:hypothetical protein